MSGPGPQWQAGSRDLVFQENHIIVVTGVVTVVVRRGAPYHGSRAAEALAEPDGQRGLSSWAQVAEARLSCSNYAVGNRREQLHSTLRCPDITNATLAGTQLERGDVEHHVSDDDRSRVSHAGKILRVASVRREVRGMGGESNGEVTRQWKPDYLRNPAMSALVVRSQDQRRCRLDQAQLP